MGCDPPLLLVNGQITPSTITYSVGQTVTFTCSDGFQLIGPSSTTCMITDGRIEWSADTPFCYKQGMLDMGLVHKAVD